MVLWLQTMQSWSAQQYNFVDNPPLTLAPLLLAQGCRNLVVQLSRNQG
jgi:hypothetical protein